MDELVITLADDEVMTEMLSGLSTGDSLTGTVSLKVNMIDGEMAKFDVESFSPDPVVSEAADPGVTPAGEPAAPPAPTEPSAVTNLFPGMM